MDKPNIQVELSAEPVRLTSKSLPAFTVHGVVRNLGGETIDTLVHASEMLVNGAASMAWSMAIGNGTRDEREQALPPGQRVAFSRVMGGGLFSDPGVYNLVLRVRGVESRPIQVRLARD